MITNKEKNFISAVVYVHNNEKEIGNFLEKLNSKLSENFEKYEIICVNDKSTDDSVEEIKRISRKYRCNYQYSKYELLSGNRTFYECRHGLKYR